MDSKFSALDVASFPAVKGPADLGCATQQLWIDIRDFVIDRSYQRDITNRGRKNIIRIAGAFNWSCFSPVIASPVEGGLYAIVDGQHRTLAAKLLGVEKVPSAIVIMSAKEQAEAFQAINGNLTRISRYQMFRAEIKSGKATSLKVAEICAKLEIRIVFNVASPAFSAIACISTLESVLKKKGEAALLTTLKCLIAGTERSSSRILRAEAVEGLSSFLVDTPKYMEDEGGLISKFGALDIEEICQEVRREYAQKRGVTHAHLFYAKMCEILAQKSILKVA